MAKHKLLKQRINKEAWEMKTFSANQLRARINDYPNMDGRSRTKNLQVTIHRLANLLKGNPNVKYIPNDNHKHAGMWEWIGEEE